MISTSMFSFLKCANVVNCVCRYFDTEINPFLNPDVLPEFKLLTELNHGKNRFTKQINLNKMHQSISAIAKNFRH